MMHGTKGGAQNASSLRPRCFGEVDPKTATHIYLPIYSLTLWSRGLLEKLTGSQLVKKFSAFYGTQKFIIAQSFSNF
jgi:hypothetical protein